MNNALIGNSTSKTRVRFDTRRLSGENAME